MANTKDMVFDKSIEDISDFDVVFDMEDSLIDTVCGVNENGEPLTGRDPEEEYQTDASDNKVDIEGEDKEKLEKENIKIENEANEEKTDETDEKDVLADVEEGCCKEEDGEEDMDNVLGEPAETLEPESCKETAEEKTDETDMDDVLGDVEETAGDVCPECGSNPCKCEKVSESEEKTDETDKKDVLADVEEGCCKEEDGEEDMDDVLGDEEDDIDIDEAGDISASDVDLDEVLGEDVEGVDDQQIIDNQDGEAPKKGATDLEDPHEDEEKLDEEFTFDWFSNLSVNEAEDTPAAEEEIDYAEDELIKATEEDDDSGEASINLDYESGIDDELIDDMLDED